MPAKKAAKTAKRGHRSNNRGSLVIDLVLRCDGLPNGRFKKATGTESADVVALYVGMVKTLVAVGRCDLVLAIYRGTLTFGQVWEEYRPRADRPADLNRLPSAETLRPLFGESGALAAYVATHTKPGTPDRDNKARDARALEKVATQGATIHDLPRVLAKYRERCAGTGTPRAFNMARTTCQAFLRETVGRFHPLYAAVAAVHRMPEARKAGHPLTPDELPEFVAKVTRVVGADYAEAFYAMCVTGMRPVEYWGEWHRERDPKTGADYYRVRNAKKRGQAAPTYRLVPVVAAIAPPKRTWKALSVQFQESGLAHEHTPYDGRRTFARACEEAEIRPSRMKHYLGHVAQSVTDLYLRHDVRPYLAADGEKLRRYFGAPEPAGLRLVPDTSHDTTRVS